MTEPGTGILNRVVAWLRRGYPSGVPEHDYIALLALLRRCLTDDEVAEVSHQLVAGGTMTAGQVDIGVKITKVTGELPSDADIQRVRDHLATATEHDDPSGSTPDPLEAGEHRGPAPSHCAGEVSVVATNAGAKRSASSFVSAVSDSGDDDFGGWYVDGQPVVGADGQPVTTWQEDYPYDQRMSTKRSLQIELLRLQSWVKDGGQKVVLFVKLRVGCR